VGYQSAIIAGGAVRDAYLDRYPNDVDIFVWNAWDSSENVAEAFKTIRRDTLIRLFDLKVDEDEPIEDDDPFNTQFFDALLSNRPHGDYVEQISDPSYTGKEGHILSVWQLWIDDFESKYQIIVVNKNPIEYVCRHFDIGLCMCYCDGVKMRYTDEFLTDATNKTLTICGELTESEYHYTLDHHIEKLKIYFPNYTVVDKLKNKFATR